MDIVAPEEVAVILPFHPGKRDTQAALSMLTATATRMLTTWKHITIVEDGIRAVPNIKGVRLITLPRNRGKIAAVRAGMNSLLRDREELKYFCAVDFDDEQEQDDLPKSLTPIVSQQANAVVSNRYAYFTARQTPAHRQLANKLNYALSQALGFQVTDLAAAMVACDRTFASLFVKHSRSQREGIGFDWLALSFLHSQTITNAPVHAKMRSNATDGNKLLRNYRIILNYREELEAAGATRLLQFCDFYVTALSRKDPEILLPVELLGVRGDLMLIRHHDNEDYSYVGQLDVPHSGLPARRLCD